MMDENCTNCGKKQYCNLYSSLILEAFESDLTQIIISYRCNEYSKEDPAIISLEEFERCQRSDPYDTGWDSFPS